MDHAIRIKQLRRAAKMSQIKAAVMAGVSPVSWRLFEANEDAVSSEIRERCKTVELSLEQTAGQRVA